MGCGQSQLVNSPSIVNGCISVATLNYGGILNSPLQFFSESEKQEHQISMCFRNLLPLYFKDFDQKSFKWDIGKIDQKMQKQRYTPIYRPNVGIQNGKLIGQQQFKKHWDQSYKASITKKKVQPQPTPAQIQAMRKFDLICYHTLLKFIYKINQLKEIETGKFLPNKYIQLTEKYFSRCYLDEDKKIKKVMQALKTNSCDVFFFQQPTIQFINEIKKYDKFFLKQNGQDVSMLLVRKSSFSLIDNKQYLKTKLNQKQISTLNWDGDTSHVICDNYLFISGHLSSKKQKNSVQVEQMKTSLLLLRQKCPDIQIVVGADTNSFVTTSRIQEFESYPNVKKAFTTRKKRTFMQPQFNKADQINQECKDQIFSTLKMINRSIMTISNKQVTKQQEHSTLLPTEAHPFDHFMIVVTLQKPKPKQK